MQDQIEDLRSRLKNAAEYLRLDELRQKKIQLESEAADQNLWDDPDKARLVTSRLSAVVKSLSLYDRLEDDLSDLEVLYQLAEEGAGSTDQAESDLKELEAAALELSSALDELEFHTLFSQDYDENDAVCRIKSGAGGKDAQDWAEMLLRMYVRWAELNDFQVEMNSINEAEGGGISSAEFIIKGSYAYGNLRSEHGVHRLVRISPFSKEGKRETSFAAMSAVPLLEDLDESLDIEEKDLRIDTFRSSGAGGQHVNTTDSAVRITHLPTGMVTSCQAERSQYQNRERAMQMLISRLLDIYRRQRSEELEELAGNADQVDFGSQIRSYVTHPYQMVKDLRTEFETARVEEVLDGELEGFIQSYLRWMQGRRED